MNLIYQHKPNATLRGIGIVRIGRLRFAMLVAFLLAYLGAFAQHDVALEKYVDRDSVKAGDTVTWTLRLFNQNHTDVTGLQVRDTLLPGLTYLSHSAPAGTTFNVATGIWEVNSQLNAATNELELTIKTRVEYEGMYMNIAEVIAMNGTDTDSEPNNNELLEDDMHKACVSVPITICSQLHDSVRVTLLPMFTNIQWFKNGVLIPASEGGTQDTFYITTAGIYAFTATQNGCPTLTCCPVVVKDSCYDLALRKTLALGQSDTVIVGSLVNFKLEIFNQGDLAAKQFSVLDYIDQNFFAPFNLTNNPPGVTNGGPAIPYAWSAVGNDGKVTLNGQLLPGESVQLPITLKVAHGGQATNFAEIDTDDDRDSDSQPESQEHNGNSDTYVDNEINNGGGDEDDHDGATLTVLASALGNFVWHDVDHDGQQDAGEAGVEHVIVYLYDADSTLLATDTTDATGYYFFNDLPPGDYYVHFDIATLPTGLEPTIADTGDDTSDSDAGPSGWTSIIHLDPAEVDPTIDLGIFTGDFDLALTKNLAPGQSNMIEIGQEVHYFISVTNQGLAAAQNVVITDHIPSGMVLSANNPGWTLVNDSTANYTFATTLEPGVSDSVEIVMIVIYGNSGVSLVNMAEIVGAENEDGVFVTDVDSTPGNGTSGEDDIDDEVVELLPHDPTGWIYCDKTGRIITGGKITVTGPNGIPNSQVFLLHDGSEGFYEFYTNGTPGTYTISYTHPLGYPLSPNCPPLAGPFDPTGLPSPVVLGSDTLNMDYIEDKTCAGNPYYMAFEVQPGDPIILHNNLPVQCILIASIVCEDANHNDQIDAGDLPIPGATVNLYNCVNPNTPILTTVSDSLGHYRFDGLDPGSYMVGYSLSPGVRPVSSGPIGPNGFSQCITLAWGQCDTNTVICLYECPDVDAGPDMAQCSNAQSSQLSASVPYGNGSFTWSPPAGLSNPNIANPIAMPSATATYTVTFNDGKGCVDSDAMTLQIGNPFPFVANAPFTDTTIECNSLLTPFDAPLFADGCDSLLDITLDSTVQTNPCSKIITRTWTATNDNGNSASFTQTVNLVDNTPPVLFATHSFFGQIHHGDTLYADCTQIASLDSIGFSATDFCSATTHNFTETVVHGDCTPLAGGQGGNGFLENRYCGWTATDACGNTDSLYFHVIISDSQPPILAGVPADVTMACNQAAPPVANVTANDLCSGGVPVSFSQTQMGSGCATTLTRTWTAVDACGNSVSASQIIHLSNDHTPPVLAGIPANTTATCSTIPPVPANITATDNCDADVQIGFSESIAGGNCNYTLTRTWTATDDCGNVSIGVQTITLTDDEAPVLVGLPAADITASCGNLPTPPNVTATDGCDPDVPVVFTETQTGSGCAFTFTRKWTATDDCGHTTSFTQTIHVVDDQGPVITVTTPGLTWLADGDTLIRQCNQVISLTAGNAIAVDACCSVPPTMTFHEYLQAGTCQDDGYIQIMNCEWTATDCCGNVSKLGFTVIVTDTIAPKLYGVPADLTLACGQTPSPTLPTVTAVDNCSSNLPVFFTSSTTNFPGGYVLTRLWSATDNCGNIGTKTQHITVTLTDLVPPVLANVPTNLSLTCGAPIPPAANNVTATDFCDATPTISFSETTSGNTSCGTITRTWTATDDAGNSSSASQMISISDTVAPVFSSAAPPDVSVECNAVPAPASMTATDNCDANVQVDFAEMQQGSGCNYTLTRTWTATDDCGNQAVAQQTIHVNDTQDPAFVEALPQDLSVECASAVPIAAVLTATDNCSTNVQVVFAETKTGSGCNYTLTRTWTASDDCGNQTVAQQTINVNDSQAPVFAGVLPQNLSVECSAAVPVPATLTATDDCDANVQVVFAETQTGNACSYTLTRTWTASDDCGNQTVAQQTINVNDSKVPVFAGVLPQNLSVECSAAVPAPANLTVTDNCDANVQVVFAETQTGNAYSYTLIRTWTATDDCGNQTIAQQTINVNDSKVPVFAGVLPQNLSVECSAAVPAPANLTATDNCDANVQVIFAETQIGNACSYTLTRTWTATDDCGNQTIAQQIVNVEDTTPPVMFAAHAFFGEIHHGDTLYADCSQIPSLDSIGFSAYDLCGATTTNFTETVVHGNCPTDGFAERRFCDWTATDACGNTDSLYFTVIISDLLPPTLVGVPADINAGCGNVPPVPTVTATDNCTAVPVVSLVETTAGTGCNLTITRTWTATDGCGNTSSQSQIITLGDAEPPVFTGVFPPNITVLCGNVPAPATLTATDNCDANVEVDFGETQTGGGCNYTLTRTWTAMDDCGNQTVAQQIITVVDSSNLHIEFSNPLLIGLVDGDTLTISCSSPSIFDASDAMALEGCGGDSIIFKENGITPGNCIAAQQGGDGFIVTMHCTWIASDTCGNTASVTLHIVIVDKEPPVFANVPEDTTINCGEPLPPCGEPTATDACGSVFLTNNTTTVATANGYERICQWTVIDGCGNIATATSTVHVVDLGIPLITGVPADTTIYLANGETLPAVANVTATEGCPGQAVPVIFSETSAPMSSNGCMNKITRTWTVTSASGVTVVQQQEIIVIGFNDANVASVTPDTCGMGVGAVVFAPSNYAYNWSIGGISASQSGLTFGSYSVTATNTAAGGCSKVINVTVGNVQVTPTVTAINTTAQSCNGNDGTATIAPANLNYVWSDGGTGAMRTGLAAGSYNVTATEGPVGTGCSLVLVVNITNGCNCVPATISSLTTTNATCGTADGTATLNMTVNPADYGFLWIPNFGQSNGNDDARTALPAGHYIVLATYNGNNNCVEKFEFDIFDDCPKCAPIFNADSLMVSVNASPSMACIPIPFALLSQNQLQMDGAPYTGSLEPCEAEKVVKYGFGALPGGQLAVRWQFAADTFYTMTDRLSSVAAFLNALDANGDWYFDKAALEFVSGNLGGNYGKLQITHLPTGEIRESNPKQAKSALGTSILLTTGTHQLVLSDSLMGCSDTLIITVNEAIIVVHTPPILQSDTLRTLPGKTVQGNVLANDNLHQKVKNIKISEQPGNGEAWVNVDNTVSYRPLIEYCNSYKNMPPDGFTYEVCFEDGSKGQASVMVFVDCVDDLAPVQEIVLYPNPATRFVNLDLSSLAGQSADVVVYNNLGVRMTSIRVENIETLPLRIELAGYAAGQYTVQVKSAGNRPFVRKFIVAGH